MAPRIQPSSTPQESSPQAQTDGIVYSTPLEARSSELQRVWTKTTAAGPCKGSSFYTKISVLTISWDPHFDDLGDGVQDEIKRLEAVFKDTFNFSVTNVILSVSDDPQVCLNDEVGTFVRRSHGPDHLLIVYYAGHGRPGTSHGELVVFKYVLG